MGQSVMQEDWFAVFKFRVTVRAHLIKYDCLPYVLNCYLFGTKLNWIIISWSAFCKSYIVVFKVKITVKVQNFIESLCSLYLLYH